MVSVATAGGSVINYSPRFSVAGMTGTFPANVVAGIGTISGTDGPATENNVAQNQAAAQDPKYAVPYTLQTGLTKYAPMQPQPPTKITAQSASPMWPTSSVSIATTWLPRPSQVTTSTQTQTFSMSSMENTVSSSYRFPTCWLIQPNATTSGCPCSSAIGRYAEVFGSVEGLIAWLLICVCFRHSRTVGLSGSRSTSDVLYNGRAIQGVHAACDR